MSLLGLDVGTTGCKAVLFRGDGSVLGSAYAEYETRSPGPRRFELDSAAVWLQIKEMIRAVCAAGKADPLRAVAIASMGESVVPVTRHRQILGPSMLNFDERGQEYLPRLSATLSDEQLYAINGNTLGNHYSLTKLMWIQEHQPDLWAQADYFLHWSSFVAFMLGADPALDYSLANRTLLFDLERQDWSNALINVTGLDASRLPPTIPSGQVIGQVLPSLAGELGLPLGVAIVSGAHDQCANGVGCGILQEGQAMFGMGTYLTIMPAFSHRPAPDVMVARGLCTEHHAAPGLFVSFIYNMGGGLVKWHRDTFAAAEKALAQTEGRDLYSELIAELPVAPGKIVVLPHFSTTGPPHFIADSCGVIAGLRVETSRGEILKGILEGVTFYLRQNLDGLPGAGIEIRELRVVGGGSQSDAWVQLSADILGVPCVRTANLQAGSLGAAILAGAATGEFASLEDGCQAMVHLGRRFDPDPVRGREYAELYEKYSRLWPLMADYLRDLAQ
jgi:xylulokinase